MFVDKHYIHPTNIVKYKNYDFLKKMYHKFSFSNEYTNTTPQMAITVIERCVLCFEPKASKVEFNNIQYPYITIVRIYEDHISRNVPVVGIGPQIRRSELVSLGFINYCLIDSWPTFTNPNPTPLYSTRVCVF